MTSETSESVARACRDWATLLGHEAVLDDPAVLAERGRTTLPSAPRPAAVIVPAAREQVPDIVRVAARHRVPLYPVSCGKNWGWGDACPVTGGQVVVDLSRLTALDIDEELGIAVVEPGVTQLQLAERIQSMGWMADCTTAGPATSVLGNTVERGIGQTALAERWSHVWAAEAVLADGTVVRTGFGASRGRRGELVQPMRWGAGPVLDGLFAQSSLGIVTRLAVGLQPRPERVEALLAVVPDEALEEHCDRLRSIRLRGAPMGAPHTFPLRRPGLPNRWLTVGALAGMADVVACFAAELDRAFNPPHGLGRMARYTPDSLGDRHVELLDEAGLPDEPVLREFLDAGAAYSQGWPLQLSPQFVLNYVGGAAGQRLTTPPTSVDPLAVGYGFEFAWPTSPAIGSDVRAMCDLVEDVLTRHGRPFAITLSSPNARAVVAVTRVPFAKDDPEDAAVARRCYSELVADCTAAGFPQARVSISSMQSLDPSGDAPEWAVVRRIKEALDPEGVIAPGKYEPWR